MNSVHAPKRARQQGVAAIEFALILPLLVILLAFPLYFGRVFWHYAVAQKAAQSAVQFLATAPLADMKDTTKAGYTDQLAKEIAHLHVDELNPGRNPILIYPQCNGVLCNGYSTPTTVRVVITGPIEDIFFPDVSQLSITITADASMSYTGK